MIKLRVRDIKELKSKIGKNNLLITCSMCPYWNYNREEIDNIANKLNAGIFSINKICEREKISVDVSDYDSILVFSCGAGVQIISEIINRNAIPVADTAGIGVRFNKIIKDYCKACGSCVLDKTASICPITRCPKGLLNGPCNDVWRGICRINNQPCVWVLIFERIKRFNNLNKFLEPNMPLVAKM